MTITDADRDAQGFSLPCISKLTNRDKLHCNICLETQSMVGVSRIYPGKSHPLRCQTCETFKRCKRGKAFCGEDALGKREIRHTEKYGCIRHSDVAKIILNSGAELNP